MRNLVLDEQQFEPERNVVMEERRLRTDNNPIAALFEMLAATAYVEHPYQWPVIGWMNDIAQAARETTCCTTIGRYYKPGQRLRGRASATSTRGDPATSSRQFGACRRPRSAAGGARQGAAAARASAASWCESEAGCRSSRWRTRCPNLHERRRARARDARDVLSGGKSSRLYQRAGVQAAPRPRRRRELRRDLDRSRPVRRLRPAARRASRPPQLEKALLAEIDPVQKAPVTARELRRRRTAWRPASSSAQDSLFYQGLLLGQYEIAGGWRQIDEYVPAIDAVTAEDRAAGRQEVPDGEQPHGRHPRAAAHERQEGTDPRRRRRSVGRCTDAHCPHAPDRLRSGAAAPAGRSGGSPGRPQDAEQRRRGADFAAEGDCRR